MQKLYLGLLLVLFVFGCTRRANDVLIAKPIYSDFKNVWEEKNLFGKVKEIEWSKTVYQRDKEDDRAILNLKESFTDFGALKETSYYNSLGTMTQHNIFEYNDKKFNFKTISTNTSENQIYTQIAKKDQTDNTEIRDISVGNKSINQIKIFYNDIGKIVKEVKVGLIDSILSKTSFKLDKSGRIISEIKVNGDGDEPIYSSNYEYNKTGNLIRSSFENFGATTSFENEWKDGQITKRRTYKLSQASKNNLEQEEEFDKLYNLVTKKIYGNSKVIRELKYTYEYDKHGNWTRRDISMRDNLSDSKMFKPIYNETRKIEYAN